MEQNFLYEDQKLDRARHGQGDQSPPLTVNDNGIYYLDGIRHGSGQRKRSWTVSDSVQGSEKRPGRQKKGGLTYLTDRSGQRKVTWNISQILQLSEKGAGIPPRYVRSSNKELEYVRLSPGM
jgi:hypothetical protein